MSGEETRTRVLIVDDQALFRGAVAALVDAEPDFVVVGQAADGLEGVDRARALRPDLVLMDVNMPRLDGVSAAERVLAEVPGTRVVMLTASAEDDQLLTAVRHGVHGFLLKDLDPPDFLAMLRGVRLEETPVSPSLVGRLLAELRASSVPSPAVEERPEEAEPLSARELEILRLVAEGLSNREIGHRLFITEGTVKNHVHNALRKLRLENRSQAAAWVVRHGL